MRHSKTKEKAPKTPEERILEAVAFHYEFEPRAMKSAARCKPLAWARHVAMFLTWRLFPQPYRQIAEVYGRKNHATVGHALQHVQKKMKTDKTVAAEVEQVARAIAA